MTLDEKLKAFLTVSSGSGSGYGDGIFNRNSV